MLSGTLHGRFPSEKVVMNQTQQHPPQQATNANSAPVSPGDIGRQEPNVDLSGQPSRVQKFQRALRANGWLIAIMICAVTTALSHHFIFGHPRATLIYDARSYLWTSAQFAQFFIDLSHFHWSPQLMLNPKFQEHVVNDGPLFTSFMGGIFALFQHVPAEKDWFNIEIIQSVLHGLTAGLVYLITLRLFDSNAAGISNDSVSAGVDADTADNANSKDFTAKNKSVGVETKPPGARIGATIAGFLWALYPAASIATGFFYTETFVVFVVSLFIWSAVSSNASRSRDLLCGFCAGLVFLLKPALVPAAVLSCGARLLFSPKKAAAFSAMAVALALTIAPWALYTHFVCGKMQITTPRFAAYNMAMGSDTEAEGRLVLPITPLTNFNSANDKDALFFVASQWKYNTAESLHMTVKKVTRLLGYPWNDFRQNFLGLNPVQQRAFHVLLLSLGLIGCSLAAFSRKADRGAMPILVVMAFMWTPLTYLLFESNSRYGFSVMPFYAIFTGFLIAHLAVPSLRTRWQPLALSVVAGAALTTVILQCANWVADPSAETVIKLKPQQTLVSHIDLKSLKPPAIAYEALILVDGERPIEGASVNFNGHDLHGRLQHLRYLDSGLYDGYYVSKEMAHFMGAEPEDFRQWRAVRIPKEWINWSSDNQIRITAGPEGGTVYGDTAPLPERLPSFRHACPNRLVNTDTGFENRIPLLRPSRSVALNSYLEGEPAAKINGSSRVRIAIVTDSMKDRKKLDPVSEFGNYKDEEPAETLISSEVISPERFPVIMRSATGDGTIATNRMVMNHASPCIEIKLPAPSSNDNIYKFRLTGSVRSNKPGRVSALLCNGRFAVLSKVPPSIDCGPEWKTFELEDRMPVRLLRSKPTDQPMVALALYPGQWLDESGYGASKGSSDARFRDLKLSVWSSKQLNLANKQVYVY